MIKNLLSLLLFSVMLTSISSAIAKEPTNLTLTKQGLKRYHDSGAYLDDIANVTQQAMRYIELRQKRGDFHGKKPVIILDIDETALSNYPNMVSHDFGGTLQEFRANEMKGNDEAIKPTLKLYHYAKAHHIAVIFITGRYEEERQATEENLLKAGFGNHDGLILRTNANKRLPASVYKTAIRKQLTEQGYDIIANIGDQKSDLRGGYADETFKLPNPYYLIP